MEAILGDASDPLIEAFAGAGDQPEYVLGPGVVHAP